MGAVSAAEFRGHCCGLMAPSLYDVLIGVRQVALPEHVFLLLNETADTEALQFLEDGRGSTCYSASRAKLLMEARPVVERVVRGPGSGPPRDRGSGLR